MGDIPKFDDCEAELLEGAEVREEEGDLRDEALAVLTEHATKLRKDQSIEALMVGLLGLTTLFSRTRFEVDPATRLDLAKAAESIALSIQKKVVNRSAFVMEPDLKSGPKNDAFTSSLAASRELSKVVQKSGYLTLKTLFKLCCSREANARVALENAQAAAAIANALELVWGEDWPLFPDGVSA